MTVRGGGRPRGGTGQPGAGTGDPSDRRPVVDRGWDDDGYAFDPLDSESPAGIRRSGSYEPRRDYRRTRGPNQLLRFLLFALVLGSVVVAGLIFVARPFVVGSIVNWAAENPTAQQVPFVADIVRGEFHTSLTQPIDASDTTPVSFLVTPGETPRQIAEALVTAHLVKDARAFVFESIQKDAASRFVAGAHILKKSMTIDQILAALASNPPPPPSVKLTFREGLRIEQMTAFLELKEAQPEDPAYPLKLDVKQFYDLARNPPAALVAKYTWLKPGVSLEGFLFPATYTLAPDASATDLITLLLDAFASHAPRALLALPPDQVYRTVQLASLVETEAKVDAERPLIAGVYANRLNPKIWSTGLLDADPTLNYANDSVWLASHPMASWVDYVFWNRIQAPDLGKVVFPADLAGFQTYSHPGLPPTPICSPSLASIQAAMAPDTSKGYLYFVAKNDGSGTHAFAKTKAEQDANLKKYGYVK